MLKKCENHLKSAEESYGQHFYFASRFGLQLIGAGLAVLIHSVCPALFQTTGSSTIFRLNDQLKSRVHTHAHHRHDDQKT